MPKAFGERQKRASFRVGLGQLGHLSLARQWQENELEVLVVERLALHKAARGRCAMVGGGDS